MAWQIEAFDKLSGLDIADIYALRQTVFIIEQHCIYPDIDGLDQGALHVFHRDENSQLIAYARILAPGVKYNEWAIGRVAVTQSHRNQGLGKQLMQSTMLHIRQNTANAKIRISAQQHLQKFYYQLGFDAVSEPYDEDGIVHIEMLNTHVS